MVLTPEGSWTNYQAPSQPFATSSHYRLEQEFASRDDAIEAYSHCVNEDVWAVPRSMILVEEHHIDLNWEE